MTADRKRNYRRAEPVSEPVSSIFLLHTMRDPDTLYSHVGTCCEPLHTLISVEGFGITSHRFLVLHFTISLPTYLYPDR